MRFLKLFITIVAIVVSSKAVAQKGYFITNKNDTVKCTFSGLSFKPYLRYKLTDDSKALKVNMDTLKEYGAGGGVVAKRKLSPESDYEFLEWVVRGRLNLFLQRTPGGYVDVLTYYAGIGNDSILSEIKTTRYFGSHAKRKAAFNSLIADAPEIAQMFATEDSYEISPILRAVKNYNLYHSKGDIYFVNNKGDTTRCKIILGKDDLFLYKTPFSSEFKPLAKDSLNAYVIGETLYYRQTVPEREGPQFITQIIKGKLSAYKDLKGNIYIKKVGTDYIKVKGEKESPKHKNTFFYLISDNPEIAAKYISKSYDNDSLIQMIQEYNGKKS